MMDGCSWIVADWTGLRISLFLHRPSTRRATNPSIPTNLPPFRLCWRRRTCWNPSILIFGSKRFFLTLPFMPFVPYLLWFLKMGCGSQLNQWLEDHKIGWVTVLAAIGAFEFMATVIAVFILRRLKVSPRAIVLNDGDNNVFVWGV